MTPADRIGVHRQTATRAGWAVNAPALRRVDRGAPCRSGPAREHATAPGRPISLRRVGTGRIALDGSTYQPIAMFDSITLRAPSRSVPVCCM